MSNASPHPWVDLNHYPIVVIDFPRGATTSELLEMTSAMRRFASALREPIALVTDISAIHTSDPDARAIYVEFVRDMRQVAGHWVRGAAVVTRSAFQRTMLNLHSILVGQTPYPVRGFASRSDAIPWLEARLEVSP